VFLRLGFDRGELAFCWLFIERKGARMAIRGCVNWTAG
jgi:hypothetical protein